MAVFEPCCCCSGCLWAVEGFVGGVGVVFEEVAVRIDDTFVGTVVVE